MIVTVIPSGAALGAEIAGVDLAKDIDDGTFNKIDDAFAKHAVIFFRSQSITPAQLLKFSRRFGELESIHVAKESLLQGYPEILIISNIIENGRPIGLVDAGGKWHSDFAHMAEPSRCSILHALEVPFKDGKPLGSTLFASTTAAYDALSAGMKARLDGLKAAFRNPRLRLIGNADLLRNTPDAIHPVIRTHPVTRRKCIYANEGVTAGIVGMPDDESRPLLEEIFRHQSRTEFVYRHDWRAGDVLVGDNCSAQHRAIFDYALPQRRLMHRTTVKGSVPF